MPGGNSIAMWCTPFARQFRISLARGNGKRALPEGLCRRMDALWTALLQAAGESGAELAQISASYRAWNIPLRTSPGAHINLRADINGKRLVYPASVSKLFFLLAAHDAFESGALAPSPELDRALADMITVSG